MNATHKRLTFYSAIAPTLLYLLHPCSHHAGYVCSGPVYAERIKDIASIQGCAASVGRLWFGGRSEPVRG